MVDKSSSLYVDKSRYIPLTRHKVVTGLLQALPLLPERDSFRQFIECVNSYYYRQAYHQLDDLKQSFSDNVFSVKDDASSFYVLLNQLLNQANYTQLTADDVQQAFGEKALFKIKLAVDFDEFEDCLIYVRGAEILDEELTDFFGLRKRRVKFINYQRVMIYIRYKDGVVADSLAHAQGDIDGNGVLLKLFKNVPKNDLEMLFPNTHIQMRFIDKLLIAIPAAISGGIVLTTKLGATLILLGSLIGFWLGMSETPVELDKKALVILFAGVGALGSYLWKQFSSFKNKKLKFAQRLTKNLYFKNLDNDEGVFYRILDEAQEAECKEVILAYYGLQQASEPLSACELDQYIETWLQQTWGVSTDFEIDDALTKLNTLGLAEAVADKWVGVPLSVALERLKSRL